MDARLLPLLVCPACRTGLELHGESPRGEVVMPSEPHAGCLNGGAFRCNGCGLSYSLAEEVPMLVPPGTNMDGARWDGKEVQITGWVQQNFSRARERGLSVLERDMIEAARAASGVVLDIASGPGGSYCVPMMREDRPDRLLVMSDLGATVMRAWCQCLREAGWGDRCSNLVFDARRMPFRDGSVAAVTSVGGFSNIVSNPLAYAETARVLQPGGRLFDVVRFYEEGGPTHQHLTRAGQAAAAWSEYVRLLADLGFGLEGWGVLNTGRGKTCPGDGLPLGDEAWEHRVVFATRR